MEFEPHRLWQFLLPGYLLTIALETPVLLLGLSARHSLARRLVAGLWLTACTYPIVVLVLPLVIGNPFGDRAYLIVAETFAPAAECLLFWWVFGRPPSEETAGRYDSLRDCLTIIAANLVSFLLGGWLLQVIV